MHIYRHLITHMYAHTHSTMMRICAYYLRPSATFCYDNTQYIAHANGPQCRPSTALSAARLQRPSVPPANGPQCRPPTALSAARHRPSAPPSHVPLFVLLAILCALSAQATTPPAYHLPATSQPTATMPMPQPQSCTCRPCMVKMPL